MVHEIVIGRRREDLEKYGKECTGFVGKHIVGKGEGAHLTVKVLMDFLRPHVVMVVGKRGCLPGDHLVFTKEGYKPISEVRDGKEVLSLNLEKLTVEWKKAKFVRYKIKEEEELYRFKLEDGREIIATKEHPLLVFNNNAVLWKEACNITEDDKLIVLTDLPEVKNDRESLRVARLLGFILADGTISIRKGRFRDGRRCWYNGIKKRIRITTSSLEIANQAKRDFEDEFNCNVRIDKRKDENRYDVIVTNSKVVDRIIELGVPPGKKAKRIRVPKVVWESSNRFKSHFLSALFSCDGYVSKNGGKIEYYTASKKFATELQLLLSHFSIESSIGEKNTPHGKYYIVRLTDHSSLMSFKNRIGFIQRKKNLRLSKKKFGVRKGKVKTTYLNDLLACRRIVKIDKIRGIKEVFDLVVDDNHSFIANGIVSHNSGKSYSGGVIAEEIALLPEEYRKNLCVVMIDTMGIYWSMKYPNEAQLTLLDSWGLQPKGLGERVKIYVPFKQFEEFKNASIPVDFAVSVEPWRFDAEDWSLAFNLPRTSPQAIALEKTINKLKERNERFLIQDIITEIRDDRDIGTHVKDALENMLLVADSWGVFGTKGIPIDQILKPGVINVFDVSRLRATEAWSVRNLLVAILARDVYQKRVIARKQEELAKMGEVELKERFPMVWLIVDEAHNFVSSEEITVSTRPLLTIVKQGREPGVSFVPMTQMPNKLHPEVIAQTDLVISHRLTAKSDIDALHGVMQTYMREDLWKAIEAMPRWRGAAVVLDDNSERLYTVQIRPRLSWHAGEAAIAT